ncbi:MAG: MFS transporter [Pseudomonadota bacterium]
MSSPDSIWAALGHRTFRRLWLASVALNLTIWMQSVGAAWLMVSLTTSPLMVALIQTASALPSFLFALPAGVMADLLDRRRYLMSVLVFMVLCAALLCLLSAGGNLGPWTLLLLTFCLGTGFALQGPAWFTAQAESVPHPLLASALALSALSYSSARAVGPAAAGAVVSTAGVLAVFVLSALLLGAALLVVACWKNPKAVHQLPPENLLAGINSALRYVRHSHMMKVQIVRTVLFVGTASALWALLPLLAGSGAGAYGLLLGSMGAGSVAGALLLPKLKDRVDINRMMALAVVVYALATLAAAFLHSLPLLCVALALSGVAWICVGNTNMLALQSAVPGWIRARSLAVFMLSFQGAMAAGSAFWGAVATHAGAKPTLAASAALMALVMFAMHRLPARLGELPEVTAAGDALHGEQAFDDLPEGASIAVQISYQVAPEQRDEFVRLAYAIGKVRRRDGASLWRLYRALGSEAGYVERFVVDSWHQYLRQRGRATMADLAAERKLWSLHSGSAPPRIEHFVSEAHPAG